jgi:hypothetical protein
VVDWYFELLELIGADWISGPSFQPGGRPGAVGIGQPSGGGVIAKHGS